MALCYRPLSVSRALYRRLRPSLGPIACFCPLNSLCASHLVDTFGIPPTKHYLGPTRFVRGARKTISKTLDDLPQGTLALEPLAPEKEPTYPVVIQQVRENMDKFTNCVILTRVGSFYEVRPAWSAWL